MTLSGNRSRLIVPRNPMSATKSATSNNAGRPSVDCISGICAVTPASAVERALTSGGALWEEEARESCSNRKGEGYHLWRSNASCHGISGAHLRATVYRREA
ncbi:hypothetical protein CDAR_438421 [Caerostris darwini]|uniref:Uncharacterized protein n=1 Tax=Caerostris darwini TaxID=1538125 RepID=A0AAV4X3K1_9ARAC|nr:hypothetical protein CDAR_438421 [Caerostris darwini]